MIFSLEEKRYIGGPPIYRAFLFEEIRFSLIFTTKVQLRSAVCEVYARNILLIATFRAEIATRWFLETFLELWVVVQVSSNFFLFFCWGEMNSSAFALC
jgi:hypothetical protein